MGEFLQDSSTFMFTCLIVDHVVVVDRTLTGSIAVRVGGKAEIPSHPYADAKLMRTCKGCVSAQLYTHVTAQIFWEETKGEFSKRYHRSAVGKGLTIATPLPEHITDMARRSTLQATFGAATSGK